MAKIYFLADGISPMERDPVAEQNLTWCRDDLGLQESDWREPQLLIVL